jgi:hypothetical protein
MKNQIMKNEEILLETLSKKLENSKTFNKFMRVNIPNGYNHTQRDNIMILLEMESEDELNFFHEAMFNGDYELFLNELNTTNENQWDSWVNKYIEISKK